MKKEKQDESYYCLASDLEIIPKMQNGEGKTKKSSNLTELRRQTGSGETKAAGIDGTDDQRGGSY